MRSEFKYVWSLSLFIFLISFMFLAAYPGVTRAQECSITIFKSAPEDPDQEFVFTIVQGGIPSEETLVDGDRFGRFFAGGVDFEVIEDVPQGWLLADIVCVDVFGLNIINIENGISVQCIGPNVGEGVCTFVNVLESRPIPTLSEWGMIAAAGGLMLVGVWFAIKKRRAAA
jgi:hypothetical protein